MPEKAKRDTEILSPHYHEAPQCPSQGAIKCWTSTPASSNKVSIHLPACVVSEEA